MRLFATVLASIVVVSPATAQKTDATLDKLTKEFVAAFNGENAAAVTELYAQDAILMPEGVPPVIGRTAIRAYYENLFTQQNATVEVTPIESAISGNSAFEAGKTLMSIRVAAIGGGGAPGSTRRVAGKYVLLYKRVGRDWKIVYDIFNSDQSISK